MYAFVSPLGLEAQSSSLLQECGEAPPRAPSSGSTVDGRYLLRRLVASGGMGAVWEAEHLFTKRIIALKLLNGDGLRSEEFRERLMREAHALTVARHPGFVDVLDAGVCRGYGPYLVMEMLEGRNLDGILVARERLPIGEVVALGVLVAAALEAAHDHGVLHRDVKPGNIFIARNDAGGEDVKLIDLGIAAIRGNRTRTADRRLTQANAVLGTPEYMAPEQLFSRDLDARADVYGLAVTLFECLTGQVPYPGTFPQVIAHVGRGCPAPPARFARPELSPAVDDCIARALSLDPDKRYPTAQAFGEALCRAWGRDPGSTSLLLGERSAREETMRVLPTLLDIAPKAANQAVRADAKLGERRHPRAPYRTPALLFEEGRTPLEARTEDLSAGGMLIVGSRAVDVGSRVQVRLALPGAGEIVTVVAVVRWVRPGRGRNAMGLELLEAPTEAFVAIEKLILST